MIRLLDRAALAGMALGAALMLWPGGGPFRAGFFVLLGATVLQIVTARFAHRESP